MAMERSNVNKHCIRYGVRGAPHLQARGAVDVGDRRDDAPLIRVDLRRGPISTPPRDAACPISTG